MKTCERGIFELIKNLAGGRVYAVTAPQNVTHPFIIFQRVSGERFRAINSQSGIAQVAIQIDCYADDYYSAKALGASVENILADYVGTIYYGSNSPQDFVKILGVSHQRDGEFLDDTDEPLLHRNMAVYLVTHEQ